jgi:hypothetical protein
MHERRLADAERAAPGPWFWTVLGAVAFAATWAVVALPVEALQRAMAPTDRDPLAFFAVYAAPDVRMLAGQLARGAVLALALLPFRHAIAARRRPLAVLFGVVFGLVALGSVEPLPGSLEGWFYTETTLLGHGVTAAAAAVHALIVASILRRALPRGAPTAARPEVHAAGRGRYARFITVHVATYLAMGLLFMTVQDYESAFATQAQFRWFRPLDDPWVAAAIPAQIPRGLLLAACLMPFVPTLLTRRHGWAWLFALLFGTTALAAPSIVPGLAGATPNVLGPASLLTGLPEVAVQMLAFSALFLAWERQRSHAPARRRRPGQPTTR